MPRTAAEIQADLDALKASGEDLRGKKARDLRAELALLSSAPPSAPPAPTSPPSAAHAESLAPVFASDDVAFVNDALAQLLLKGHGAGKVEQSYSDIRSLLGVKHILEDAAGLLPSGRLTLPGWETLGRDRDTGEKFKPGENQQVVDGLAQRAVPPPKNAPKEARPTITAPDGTPLRLPRTSLNEPDGVASFVGEGSGSEG